MAKFKSYDGVDKNGVRAEVIVQTGSGRIKELIPKGQELPDGRQRNLEVVFDPDNPHLKRRVYANLDTTSEKIHKKVLEAYENGETVEYRIESVRKRNVDRSKSFEELTPTEDVVRILAAINDVFSSEARTDPSEDDTPETPSALKQRREGVQVTTNASVGNLPVSTFTMEGLTDSLKGSRFAVPSPRIFETLQGVLLSQGAGLSREEFSIVVEETEGGGYGTYDMNLVVEVEDFVMGLLAERYSLNVDDDVSDQVFAQSTAAAEEVLKITDEIYHHFVSPSNGTVAYHRSTSAYRNMLKVVKNTVKYKRGIPTFTDMGEVEAWRGNVSSTAQERLEMMKLVVSGMGTLQQNGNASLSTPKSTSDKPDIVAEIVDSVDNYEYQPDVPQQWVESGTVESFTDGDVPPPPVPDNVVSPLVEDVPINVPSSVLVNDSGSYDNLSLLTNGEPVVHMTYPDFKTVRGGFTAPSPELVMSLKDLCERAGVLDHKDAIVRWMEFHLGKRKASDVDAENLKSFIEFYNSEGSETVKRDVLSFN